MTDSIIKSLIGSSIILFFAACALMLPGCSGLSQNTNTSVQSNSHSIIINSVNGAGISSQDKQQMVAGNSGENYDAQIREEEKHSDGYGNTYSTETGNAIHTTAKPSAVNIIE